MGSRAVDAMIAAPGAPAAAGNRSGDSPRDALVLDYSGPSASLGGVVLAEAVRRSDARHWLVRVFSWLVGLQVKLIGLATIVAGLAVLSTFPLVQFLSLGYLLECSGRVARSGRLRDGFVGLHKAAGLGIFVAGAWFALLPVRFVSAMAARARLIEPGGLADHAWSVGLWLMAMLTVAALAAWLVLVLGAARAIEALVRGESVPDALRLPARRRAWEPRLYAWVRDRLWEFATGLRLPHYFWLGLRGFVGGMIWLLLPISLLALGSSGHAAAGFVGAMGLMLVLLYLPFLQARFAAENRIGALFEVGAVRRLFRKAPVGFWLAVLITLAFALPLYLLKIEIVPREAAWLPSLVFVIFILPARLLVGWVCGYAARRQRPRYWFIRQTARLAMLPVVAMYVLIVYFTQYTSWYGVASLYEQHAFLVPVPFLGL
jgi:hypothetical protein